MSKGWFLCWLGLAVVFLAVGWLFSMIYIGITMDILPSGWHIFTAAGSAIAGLFMMAFGLSRVDRSMPSPDVEPET